MATYETDAGNRIERPKLDKIGRYWILEFFDWIEPEDEDEEPCTRIKYEVALEMRDFLDAKDAIVEADEPLVLFDILSKTAQKWEPGKAAWGAWEV